MSSYWWPIKILIHCNTGCHIEETAYFHSNTYRKNSIHCTANTRFNSHRSIISDNRVPLQQSSFGYKSWPRCRPTWDWHSHFQTVDWHVRSAEIVSQYQAKGNEADHFSRSTTIISAILMAILSVLRWRSSLFRNGLTKIFGYITQYHENTPKDSSGYRNTMKICKTCLYWTYK